MVSQQLGDNDQATVMLDLSTLRDTLHMASAASTLHAAARDQGAVLLADPADQVPFTCITDVAQPCIAAWDVVDAVHQDGVDQAVVDQGDVDQQQDEDPQCVDARAAEEQRASEADQQGVEHDQQEEWATLAIWQLPPVVVAYTCSRAASKDLAQVLLKAVAS